MKSKPVSRRGLLRAACGAVVSGLSRGSDAGCSHCDQTINCLTPQEFEYPKGTKHRIYIGGSGPPVVVLHELPGLTKADLGFAKRLIESGYTALVPLLFGNPGEDRFFL